MTSADFRAHYRGRAPIDAYGNGGFRFADMSHKGSLLIVPSGIFAWDVVRPGDISAASLRLLFEDDGRVDVVLVGTGSTQVFPEPAVSGIFKDAGIVAEFMATGAAARTYNVLLGEDRSVGAALIAVD